MARRGHLLLVAQALTLAAFILPAPLEHVAQACGNAVVLSSSERTKRVAQAQAALDEGDVLEARDLAHSACGDVPNVMHGDCSTDDDGLTRRARRIIALSFARDSEATASQREAAASVLEAVRGGDPTIDADRGEALSRVDRAESRAKAYAILEPLAKKDLVGSPHALGALVRIARERGDTETAYYAQARCEGMVGTGPVCRGDYQTRPLIRGTTTSYLPPMLVALFALALRVRRSRRAARAGTDDRGRLVAAPWIGHAAALQVLAILGAGLYVFVHPSSPAWTTTVLAAVLLSCSIAERRGFFAAVRRGKIAGLVLRPAGPDDAHLPAVALFRGPRAAETLEQDRSTDAREPGYRRAARLPMLRLGRRPLPLGLSFAGATAIAFMVVIGLLVVFSMLLTLRSS